MVLSEALALQAKLHSAAQEAMAKASQVAATVQQAMAEGRTELNEAEKALVTPFDLKADIVAKLKQFLDTL